MYKSHDPVTTNESIDGSRLHPMVSLCFPYGFRQSQETITNVTMSLFKCLSHGFPIYDFLSFQVM